MTDILIDVPRSATEPTVILTNGAQVRQGVVDLVDHLRGDGFVFTLTDNDLRFNLWPASKVPKDILAAMAQDIGLIDEMLAVLTADAEPPAA